MRPFRMRQLPLNYTGTCARLAYNQDQSLVNESFAIWHTRMTIMHMVKAPNFPT